MESDYAKLAEDATPAPTCALSTSIKDLEITASNKIHISLVLNNFKLPGKWSKSKGYGENNSFYCDDKSISFFQDSETESTLVLTSNNSFCLRYSCQFPLGKSIAHTFSLTEHEDRVLHFNSFKDMAADLGERIGESRKISEPLLATKQGPCCAIM